MFLNSVLLGRLHIFLISKSTTARKHTKSWQPKTIIALSKALVVKPKLFLLSVADKMNFATWSERQISCKNKAIKMLNKWEFPENKVIYGWVGDVCVLYCCIEVRRVNNNYTLLAESFLLIFELVKWKNFFFYTYIYCSIYVNIIRKIFLHDANFSIDSFFRILYPIFRHSFRIITSNFTQMASFRCNIIFNTHIYSYTCTYMHSFSATQY